VDDVSILAELALHMSQVPPSDSLPVRLCRAAVMMLSADGGSIVLTPDSMPAFPLAASNTVARRIESVQEIFDAGPTRSARETANLAEVSVVTASAAPSLVMDELRQAAGDVTISAYPMRVAGEVLGVLAVYTSRRRALSRPPEDAQTLADIVGAALLQSMDADPTDLVAWPARARVHQATGMVVAQLRVSPEDALTLIRARAYAQGSTIEAVSDDLVSRRLNFASDDDSTGRERS
jgi:hypothetical protein